MFGETEETRGQHSTDAGNDCSEVTAGCSSTEQRMPHLNAIRKIGVTLTDVRSLECRVMGCSDLQFLSFTARICQFQQRNWKDTFLDSSIKTILEFLRLSVFRWRITRPKTTTICEDNPQQTRLPSTSGLT